MPWTNSQLREFATILLAMGELFETPVSDARAELFTRAVEDLDFEAVKAAASDYVRTGTFFPKPVSIRERVLGNTEDQAETAWQHVLREVRRVGWCGTPSWPDERTKRAALGLYGGGWVTLCERLPGEGPELLGFRKQFIAAYGALARQGGAGELGPSREEATGLLANLKAQLLKRGLPSGKL